MRVFKTARVRGCFQAKMAFTFKNSNFSSVFALFLAVFADFTFKNSNFSPVFGLFLAVFALFFPVFPCFMRFHFRKIPTFHPFLPCFGLFSLIPLSKNSNFSPACFSVETELAVKG